MTATIRADVAAALRAEMARAGLTQGELAEKIGKRQWWVSYRATGRVPCDVEDLALFAEALGVPVATFLPTEVRTA